MRFNVGTHRDRVNSRIRRALALVLGGMLNVWWRKLEISALSNHDIPYSESPNMRSYACNFAAITLLDGKKAVCVGHDLLHDCYS
jgi:hypothetical protein